MGRGRDAAAGMLAGAVIARGSDRWLFRRGGQSHRSRCRAHSLGAQLPRSTSAHRHRRVFIAERQPDRQQHKQHKSNDGNRRKHIPRLSCQMRTTTRRPTQTPRTTRRRPARGTHAESPAPETRLNSSSIRTKNVVIYLYFPQKPISSRGKWLRTAAAALKFTKHGLITLSPSPHRR